MNIYDLIVLGTGGAGSRVAMSCRNAGWKVAAIDDGLFGGTCAVNGCIPKKVLSGIAAVADENRRLQDMDIMKVDPPLNWAEAMKLKRSFTDPVPDDTKQSLQEAGIDTYSGLPRFTGNLELEVDGHQLQAKKIHIAVGAKPAILPIDGFEHILTSDDFLELDRLPQSLIFVGGGYVSFELAHIASRFGAKATILHRSDRPLSMFDKDIVDELLEASREVGIGVELNAGVKKIEKFGNEFVVTTADGDTYRAETVIHGAGRPPAIADLDLETTNVEFDLRRGVIVNDYLQSVSNPDVYAAGDAAASGPPLSPVSKVQGRLAADNLLGAQRKQPSYVSVSSVIFSSPVAAKVGYLEQEARDNGIEIDVISTDLSEWFDSQRLGQKFARSKILVETSTNKIVGAHLLGNHAEDLINIFSLAIELGLTTDQLKQPIFAFPTTSDDLRSMF